MNAAKAAIDYWMPAIGEGLPNWAKRFEFEWDVEENIKPEFSLLTVQPIFQSPDKRETFFSQLRLGLNHQFGDRRVTSNVGFRFRRLLADDTVLAGLNWFHDYEWNYNHSRASLGGELRWAGFDLYANKYWALSSKHSVDNGAFENPLDGIDVELTAQIPYLPWARARGRHAWWDSVEAGDDIEGWGASIEMDLLQNVQVEAGYKDDNFTDGAYFAQVRFTLIGGRNKPVAASSRFIDNEPWQMRNMADHTLDKVRRENEIVVERTAGGVVIARGD